MSTTESSGPATNDGKRTYHRVFVNVNGVTKSVLVPVAVNAIDHHASPVAVQAFPRNKLLTISPAAACALVSASFISSGTSQSSVTVSSSTKTNRVCVVPATAVNNGRPQSTRSIPTILRQSHKQKHTSTAAIQETAKSVTVVGTSGVRPTNGVRVETRTPRCAAGTNPTGASSFAVHHPPVRLPVPGIVPSPVLELIRKNRPTLVITRSSVPSAGGQVPSTSSQSSLWTSNIRQIILRPVCQSRQTTTAVCRPLFSIRPRLEVRPTMICDPRSLTKEEATAVGWFDNATTVPANSDEVASSSSVVSFNTDTIPMMTCAPEQLSTVFGSQLSNEVEGTRSVDETVRDSLNERVSVDVNNDVAVTPILNVWDKRMLHIDKIYHDDHDKADNFSGNSQIKIIEICPDNDGDYNSRNDIVSDNDDDKRHIKRFIHRDNDGRFVMKIGDESFEGVPASRPNSVLSDETVSAYENEHVMMSPGETIPLVELLSQTINPLANKKSTKTRRRSSYPSSGRRRKRKRQTSSATVNDDKKTTSGTVQRTSSDADGSVSMIGSGRVQKARRTGGKPISAAERLGITASTVSIGRINLPPGKVSVNEHDVIMYACCMDSIVSHALKKTTECDLPVRVRRSALESVELTSLGSSFESYATGAGHHVNANQQLLISHFADSLQLPLDSNTAGVVATSSSVTSNQLPAAASTHHVSPTPNTLPMSTEGMPLLIHRNDGKPPGVVVARPASDKTLSKDKYLLIRTSVGAFLVPMDDGGTGKTANTIAGLLRRDKVVGDVAELQHKLVLKSSAAAIATGTQRLISLGIRSESPSTPPTFVPVVHQHFPAISSIKREPSTCQTTPSSTVSTLSITSDEHTMPLPISTPSMHTEVFSDDSVANDTSAPVAMDVSTSCDIEPSATSYASVVPRKRKGKRRKKGKSPAKNLAVDKLDNNSVMPIVAQNVPKLKLDDRPMNANRERIEMLKERLRRQEDQLIEIKRIQALQQRLHAMSDDC